MSSKRQTNVKLNLASSQLHHHRVVELDSLLVYSKYI